MEFKWSKTLTPNQKKPFEVEVKIIHPSPDCHTTFNIFLGVTNFDELVKTRQIISRKSATEFLSNKRHQPFLRL